MSTESDVLSKTRERIISRVKQGVQAKEANQAKAKKKKVPEVLFNDDVQVGGSEDTIWYSNTFEGAAEFLEDTKKPDIDITKLCHTEADWSEDNQLQIPTLDKFYVWQHEVLYPLVLAQVTGLKVLTVGSTGTGKSAMHENLAAVYKQPFYRLSGRGDMESDTILGRVDVEDGTTDFLLGEFTKAFADSFYILLDEPWKLPASINMALQRPLERGGILQIDDMKGDLKDKQFNPGKHTIIALADNVVGTGDGADKYVATMIQDGSTLNRVDLVLELGYLPQVVEAKMITTRCDYIPSNQAMKAVQMANLIRQGYDKDQLSATMSPRNLIAWMELAYKAKSYTESFKWTMLSRFADVDEKEAVKGFWSTVYGENI